MMTLIEMALDRANIPSTRYEGSMDKMKRNASLNRFRNPTGPVVLIMSLNCGSYGINLTCASHIILTDPW
jgi:SNF2 family DNA or RNA helicase